jgi:hypothetical protein
MADHQLHPQWHKKIIHYFAMFYESRLKKREKQIAFMAYHYILTRLPNLAFLEH